jgi:integrase
MDRCGFDSQEVDGAPSAAKSIVCPSNSPQKGRTTSTKSASQPDLTACTDSINLPRASGDQPLLGHEQWADEPAPPPLLPEEPPLPTGIRWWRERAQEFVRWKREHEEVSETWLRTMGIVLDGYPRTFCRAGVDPKKVPTAAKSVTRQHIRTLKTSGILAPATIAMYLTVLREFLRHEGNPLAEEKGLWAFDRGEPLHLRWLTAEQMGAMYQEARGRERVLVALEGFNGLRRIEVLRLHVRDLNLDLAGPEMNVLGKGRFGGKRRRIRILPSVYPVLVEWVDGKSPDEPLYRWHPRTADHDIRAVGVRTGLGIKVSGHDLRRSFARMMYDGGHGMSLPSLKKLLGHASVDMTCHYIGVDEQAMGEGIEHFEALMRRHTSPGPVMHEKGEITA